MSLGRFLLATVPIQGGVIPVIPVLCFPCWWSPEGLCELLDGPVHTSAEPLVELPRFICSLDIGFTVLHFTRWLNELLVTRLMFTVSHQGTILFQL